MGGEIFACVGFSLLRNAGVAEGGFVAGEDTRVMVALSGLFVDVVPGRLENLLGVLALFRGHSFVVKSGLVATCNVGVGPRGLALRRGAVLLDAKRVEFRLGLSFRLSAHVGVMDGSFETSSNTVDILASVGRHDCCKVLVMRRMKDLVGFAETSEWVYNGQRK